jgi:predicted regulator of Ras-like GTPase activity (Roadblock/LC7/MglB family)
MTNRLKGAYSFRVPKTGVTAVKRRHSIQIGGALNYVLDREHVTAIEDILERDLMDLGVHSVVLIDMAGNIVATKGTGQGEHDLYSLAALAAGNFGAVSTMAKLIGEEEFSLLFHRGKKESIHFSKVTSDFLLIAIFGKELSLGFLRLKVAEATEKMVAILNT